MNGKTTLPPPDNNPTFDEAETNIASGFLKLITETLGKALSGQPGTEDRLEKVTNAYRMFFDAVEARSNVIESRAMEPGSSGCVICDMTNKPGEN